eukprot:s103_g74.t1
MAEGAPIIPRPFNLQELTVAFRGAAPGKVLPTICFIAAAGDPPVESRVLCYLLRCRVNGFMVLLPGLTSVQALLDTLVFADGTELTGGLQFDLCGTRRLSRAEVWKRRRLHCRLCCRVRPLFQPRAGAAWIWECWHHPTQSRRCCDSSTQPVRLGAGRCVDWRVGWRTETMAEYVTAESKFPPAEEAGFRDGSGAEESVDADAIAQLQARILELEAQQSKQLPGSFRHSSSSFFAAFRAQETSQCACWTARLSQSERAQQLAGMGPGATETQDFFAEAQAGAIGEEEVTAIMANSKDPLHQILALQMQQTAYLTQKLAAQAPKDQISAALGSDSGSSSSNGVKGWMGRDAFIRAMDNVVGTGRLMLQNAANDMGLSAQQVGSRLMRQYVEKRIELADHRLLTYISQFMACSWQLAFDKNDEFAMGLMSRGLMMIEQMCLDRGRCQFGWLLSSLPDPDLQQIAQNRKRVSLKPYARMSAW